MFEYGKLTKAMADICWRMPEEIYLNEWDKLGTRSKYLLALFDDAYKSMEIFCEGMKIAAIIQSGMILRLLIEQTSIIKCLCKEPSLLDGYIHHYKFRLSIGDLSKSKQISAIKKEFHLQDEGPKALQFLDYGWLGGNVMNAKNKEDFLIEKAGFADCLVWKKRFLDKFAHQSINFVSISDTDKGFTLADPYMEIACKLFDELCCLYHSFTNFDFIWDGDEKFLLSFRPLFNEFISCIDAK